MSSRHVLGVLGWLWRLQGGRSSLRVYVLVFVRGRFRRIGVRCCCGRSLKGGCARVRPRPCA
eukprot:708000-Rhodomonas_salina.1